MNFAILLHLLSDTATADVIWSHQKILDQNSFGQNVNVYHMAAQSNHRNRRSGQIHGISLTLIYSAATFGALKMSDHEEGVAFLPKEHKEEDGVAAADGKEEGVPAGLGGDKEVGLHGHVDTDTGR